MAVGERRFAKNIVISAPLLWKVAGLSEYIVVGRILGICKFTQDVDAVELLTAKSCNVMIGFDFW